jgi:Uma2 family endonuclease
MAGKGEPFMSTTIAATPTARPQLWVVPSEPIWRLSVEQYHRMIEAGILDEDAPVELLEGLLVRKMPKKRPHSYATQLLRNTLSRVLPAGWHVQDQEPVTTKDSEPEPDLSVIRGDLRDYPDRHPGPKDTGLVIEVADATLARDRGTKKRVYARAGVPVYWIVNLQDRNIEVYTEPASRGRPPDYRKRRHYGPEEELPLLLDGREVARLAVRDLLP